MSDFDLRPLHNAVFGICWYFNMWYIHPIIYNLDFLFIYTFMQVCVSDLQFISARMMQSPIKDS